jgi:hypothetical protein
MPKQGRYEHDPKRGETRSPMTEGEQRGPHNPDERDPHEPLARPESQTPGATGRTEPREGMGSRPAARGERRPSTPMPDEND